MINNFNQIKSYLTFESNDDYYFIQILIRKKDNKTLENDKLVKSYIIKSKEYLDKHESEIKELCNDLNARAYIHLSKRNFKDVGLLMIKEICDFIKTEQFLKISKVFNIASGTCNTDEKWIVDIDEKVDLNYLNNMMFYIENECKPLDKKKCITLIETPNGYHIITYPFNIDQFKMKYPKIDIHKNNPTILYTP